MNSENRRERPFFELYNSVQARLYNSLLTIMHNANDADDVFSDVVSVAAFRQVAHWTLNNAGSAEGHASPMAPSWQTCVIDGSCPLCEDVCSGAVGMDADSLATGGIWYPAIYRSGICQFLAEMGW